MTLLLHLLQNVDIADEIALEADIEVGIARHLPPLAQGIENGVCEIVAALPFRGEGIHIDAEIARPVPPCRAERTREGGHEGELVGIPRGVGGPDEDIAIAARYDCVARLNADSKPQSALPSALRNLPQCDLHIPPSA